MEDGFKLLTTIVIKASPQLGGESRDLSDLVKSLKTNNGEFSGLLSQSIDNTK